MADKKWFADHLNDGARGSRISPRRGARSGCGARARATSSRRLRATTSRTRACRSAPGIARGRTVSTCSPRGSRTSATWAGSCTCRWRTARAVGRALGGGAAARRRPRRDRRLRHDRPAREVLPRVRHGARRGLRRRRGRHGVVEGEGRGLRRQGGARRAPRGRARPRSSARSPSTTTPRRAA